MNINKLFLRLTCFAAITVLLFLSGCSSHTTRVIDSPQVRELPGWQKPYEVDGKRYQPLSSHNGYQERGVASWYGKKFHGRKTSNGEIYNMYGLSAAHKTLPLGVSVEVTHLNSGKKIIVRINDRGPFVAGRIIDLSFGAAQQLGIVDSGTAPVIVKALGFKKTSNGHSEFVAPANYDAGSFAIQIGAFSSRANADSLAQRMRPSYGRAVVVATRINDLLFYRVRVGEYNSLAQAEQEAVVLHQKGYAGSFVVAYN